MHRELALIEKERRERRRTKRAEKRRQIMAPPAGGLIRIDSAAQDWLLSFEFFCRMTASPKPDLGPFSREGPVYFGT